jgi:hypothetical protein
MPTVKELQAEARARGIKGYSKLRKSALEQLLGYVADSVVGAVDAVVDTFVPPLPTEDPTPPGYAQIRYSDNPVAQASDTIWARVTGSTWLRTRQTDPKPPSLGSAAQIRPVQDWSQFVDMPGDSVDRQRLDAIIMDAFREYFTEEEVEEDPQETLQRIQDEGGPTENLRRRLVTYYITTEAEGRLPGIRGMRDLVQLIAESDREFYEGLAA